MPALLSTYLPSGSIPSRPPLLWNVGSMYSTTRAQTAGMQRATQVVTGACLDAAHQAHALMLYAAQRSAAMARVRACGGVWEGMRMRMRACERACVGSVRRWCECVCACACV